MRESSSETVGEGIDMRYKTNDSQKGQADTAMFRLAQFLGIFSL
jgi:hypothetical protein